MPTSNRPDPALAAHWITVCTTQSHKKCQNYRRKAGQSLQRPTRLLRLSDNEPKAVQLVEGAAVRDDPYVTLSHRWGYPDPPKLSAVTDGVKGRVSLEHLQSGVSLSILPRTFRDALSIVSHCGLQYLWIDSLCILQDQDADRKNPDWEREAAKVGDIYAGAIFNIAALNGSNSDGGLFPKQQRVLVPVLRKFTAPQASRIFPKLRYDVESTSTVLCEIAHYQFNEAILESQLLSRGWVFQEVLLTPANLFCTSEQMWWSCSHATFSHTFPRGRPVAWSSDGKKLEADELRAKKQAIMAPDDCKDPIKAWMQALQYYTRTSVTFENDRLPAISGIANMFRALFPAVFRDASYHSGVWSIELVRQLGWHRIPIHAIPASSFSTDDYYYMPSWSPASYRGPLDQYGVWTADVLPIEFVRLDTSAVDSFGRASEAEHSVLHLRGVPVAMSLGSEHRGEWEAWPTGHPNVKVYVSWDNLLEVELARAAATPAPYKALALYCFPDSENLQGLLLRPLHDSKIDNGDDTCNRWVRCGWFRWRNWGGFYSLYRIYPAFQFRRYGFYWGEKESEHSRRKREPTDEPAILDDIFIV